MLAHLHDTLPVWSRSALVRRHLLECSPQILLARYLLYRHRRQGGPLRVSRLRHRVRRRRGLVRVRSAVGLLRAVGCLAKQYKLSCLLAGRGRLTSPLLGSGYGRLSPVLWLYATIRLLSSLGHVVLSFFTTTARFRGGGREVSPGKITELRTKPSSLLEDSPTNIGLRREHRLTHEPPPYDASLALGSVLHLQLPPDTPSRAGSR